MKKLIIVSLSIINSLSCMDQSLIIREPREWDAQAYEDGNKMQTKAFMHFLTTNNIITENRTILSAGCGTAKIESILAEKATHIHGFDASKNMIGFAQNKYGHVKNLSLEHCFAEDFKSPQLYKLALASCCLHWFEDRKQALQRINNSLEVDGEFFANIQTANHPEPFTLVVFREMLQDIPLFGGWLSKCVDPTGQTPLPTNDELDAMLKETGFSIIKRESQPFDWTDTKDELKKWLSPIIMSRPMVKYLPESSVQWIFENFFNRCLEKLVKNDDGTYTWKTTTEIVHASKK